jgi:hypothetical protein
LLQLSQQVLCGWRLLLLLPTAHECLEQLLLLL